MEERRRYEQLQPEERLMLASLVQQKKGVRELVRVLGARRRRAGS